MSADRDVLLNEVEQLGKTVELMEALLAKAGLDVYERIALGTLLQNTYMGIEATLRTRLRARGLSIPQTETWHKELLRAAEVQGLVDPDEAPVFRALLLYRHRHVHGYGHRLDEERLRELATPVPTVCKAYLLRLRALGLGAGEC